MKKPLFLFSFILLLGSSGIIAQTIGHAKIKNAKDIVWFGIDCSHMQCVGRSGFVDTDDIANRMVHAWNDLFIAEHDKYNVNERFDKKEFIYDLASVEKQNDKVVGDQLVVSAAEEFDRSTIDKIVSNYSSEDYTDGLGLVFIVEKLDKLETEAKVHVTFFDIATKEIVQVVKYSGEARGFGFRNYWAGAFYDILKKLEDDYSKWSKKNK
jgi:hypothetical protein